MINMIIVEDEPIMNKFISSSIDYQSLDINLTGSFFNADDALDFLKTNSVDLIVTDIKMPKTDGLTFIDSALSLHPELKFIVLSNFDDYSFVTKAFKLGIYDYILKIDFEPTAFSNILKKVVVDIYESKKSKRETDRLSLKIQFWNGKLGESYTNKDRIGVLKILNYNNIVSTKWNMDKEILNYGICNYIEEIVMNYNNIQHFQNNYDEFIFIFNHDHIPDFLNFSETFFNFITKFLYEYSNLNSVGCVYDGRENIPYIEQYSMAIDAANYNFIMENNHFFSYSLVSSYNDTFDFDKHLTEFKNSFDKFDYQNCLKVLDEIKTLKINKDGINQLLLFYKILLSMLTNHFNITGELKKKDETLFTSASEYHDYLVYLLSTTDKLLLLDNSPISEAINYINKNYHKPITLSSLSSEFQFEYGELSRKLKAATGMSFKKYVTSLRMQEAINLIKTTDFKITDISQMVGYPNYEHFSRTFKASFNKWPTEIRKDK